MQIPMLQIASIEVKKSFFKIMIIIIRQYQGRGTDKLING